MFLIIVKLINVIVIVIYIFIFNIVIVVVVIDDVNKVINLLSINWVCVIGVSSRVFNVLCFFLLVFKLIVG